MPLQLIEQLDGRHVERSRDKVDALPGKSTQGTRSL
jgi:hypothetical protein